jgi:SAM-dependent methyltransferase
MTAPPRPTLAQSRFRRTVVHRLVREDARARLTGLYRPLLYRGARVSCPICDGAFSRFMDHRAQPSVRCPKCGSMERHRLLWLWLREESDFFTAGLRVLHFAPEYGVRKRLAALPNLDYHTADLESRLADDHFDIAQIPYPAESFDVILCNHVLEHVPDDAAALSELHRILRSDGWAILMTPIGKGVRRTVEDPQVGEPHQRLAKYGQEDHVRLYGQDFYERLRDAGLEVEAIDYAEQLSAADIERYRLRREHRLFEDDKVVVARPVPRPGEASGQRRSSMAKGSRH